MKIPIPQGNHNFIKPSSSWSSILFSLFKRLRYKILILKFYILKFNYYIIILIINKKILIKQMEKLIRYRKAFYEKENDLKYGNKKQEIGPHFVYKNSPSDKLYQSLSITLTSNNNQTPKVKPTTISLKSNTEAYCQLYGQQLLESSQYLNKPSDFLITHEINEIFRARMLDWMVEVISSYKFNNKTYFDSVHLMDRYFGASKESISSTKLHIIGVQCMMIASKMEQVYPLKIKTVYQKIAHKKLSVLELVETEEDIIKTLQYKLNTWSFYDLVMLKFAFLLNKNSQKREGLNEFSSIVVDQKATSKSNEETLKHLEGISSYLSKFALYNYEFYQETTTILLAETIVKATLEIAKINIPQNLCISTPILIELTKEKIFSLIKKHKSKFNGLNNIFKFSSKEVMNLVDEYL